MSTKVRIFFRDGEILELDNVIDSDGQGDILSIDTDHAHLLINMRDVRYTISEKAPEPKKGEHYVGCLKGRFPDCQCLTCARDHMADANRKQCCMEHMKHCSGSCPDYVKEG